MFKVISSSAVASVLLTFGLAIPALALSNRAWVSGSGSDTSGCGSAIAPCRTPQYAHDNIIAPGGEIDVLDPAGYGSITITKAVSIVNDGVGVAGLQVASGGTAITINAGTSDAVHLRGLTIEGVGTGQFGILLNSVGTLDIIDCVVRHFSGDGIHLSPTTKSNFSLLNTIVSDNGNRGLDAVPISPGTLTGIVGNSTFSNNAGVGVISENSARVEVSHSSASNSFTGFYGSGGFLFLRDVVSSGNTNGIKSDTFGSIFIGQSVITYNINGVITTLGQAPNFTYGDNYINNNSTDLNAALTPVDRQ